MAKLKVHSRNIKQISRHEGSTIMKSSVDNSYTFHEMHQYLAVFVSRNKGESRRTQSCVSKAKESSPGREDAAGSHGLSYGKSTLASSLLYLFQVPST